MDAVPNEFNVGATMVTEYDLPVNGELSLGGDIPWAILVESGQCDLMLISYMGIDFQCKGERVYRLLDTTLTFYGVASEGETLVYDIKVSWSLQLLRIAFAGQIFISGDDLGEWLCKGS